VKRSPGSLSLSGEKNERTTTNKGESTTRKFLLRETRERERERRERGFGESSFYFFGLI
jgi:hypothetical protein